MTNYGFEAPLHPLHFLGLIPVVRGHTSPFCLLLGGFPNKNRTLFFVTQRGAASSSLHAGHELIGNVACFASRGIQAPLLRCVEKGGKRLANLLRRLAAVGVVPCFASHVCACSEAPPGASVPFKVKDHLIPVTHDSNHANH